MMEKCEMANYSVSANYNRRAGLIAVAAALLAAFALSSPALEAGVTYVNAAAAGANNGTSWPNAFTSLQTALSTAAAGDEVWVVQGTYTPGPPGDAVSSFVLRDGVALYGGFAGTETSRAQRDWNSHATILSGDVGHDDVVGSGTYWYLIWNRNTANSAQVITGSGVNATAVLDGFTVADGATGPSGTPAGHPYMYGGGVYMIGGSPTIANCVFTHNLAAFGHGGAIYCQDSSPTITNCQLVENYVHLGSGGGIYIWGASQPAITGCTFARNHVVTTTGGGEGQGAGIENRSTLPITVTRCTFDSNVGRAFYSCCPIEIARGGGISSFADGLTVRECIFRSNQAHAGGGMYVWGLTTIINSVFYNNTANAIAMSGGADGGGFAGGLGGLDFAITQTTLVNCVIAGNHAREAAGFDVGYSHQFVLENCIVWGNVATGQDVSPRDAQFKGNADIFYTCLQDLLTAPPGEDPYDPADYPGSTPADPLLAGLGTGDLHLLAGSPCIDAANNTYVPADVTADLDGLPRFHDDTGTPDTGVGPPPIVDMGAYEFGAAPLLGDVDCGGAVEFNDAQTLVNVLVGIDTDACHLAAADVSGDDQVDGLDIQPFVNVLLSP